MLNQRFDGFQIKNIVAQYDDKNFGVSGGAKVLNSFIPPVVQCEFGFVFPSVGYNNIRI